MTRQFAVPYHAQVFVALVVFYWIMNMQERRQGVEDGG